VVGGFGRPAFLEHVFRPEQVMRHQEAIGLTAEQREAISGAIRETQQRLLGLRWQLDGRAEEAAKLFAGERIPSEPALALATAVMEVESEIKKEHLRLLIRIKNELTPEQQEKLRALGPKRCAPDPD
jgi:Spy/CpxP family protein refolding chaperone